MKGIRYLILCAVLLWVSGCDQGETEEPALQRLVGVQWSLHTAGELGLVQGDSALMVCVDASGKKWVFTRKGYLLRSDDGLNWVTVAADNRESTFPPATTIYLMDMDVDVEGRVWLATSIGLARFKDHHWDLFNGTNTPMPTDWVDCVRAAGDGGIWFSAGTHSTGGLMLYNGSDWTLFTPGNSSLPGSLVNAIECGSGSVIWVGTEYGLARIEGENWSTYDSANSLLTDGCLDSLAADSSGTIFVGKSESASSTMVRGLLASYDGNAWTRMHPSETEKVSDAVTALVVDNQGNLWVATDTAITPIGQNECPAGLALFNGEEWFVVADLSADFPRGRPAILHMEVDGDNTLWFVKSDAGLISLKPQLN